MHNSRPFGHITPSSALSLETCYLQAVFQADPGAGTSRPPALRLGQASHALLERIARGELIGQPESEWATGLEELWQDEIGLQERSLLLPSGIAISAKQRLGRNTSCRRPAPS